MNNNLMETNTATLLTRIRKIKRGANIWSANQIYCAFLTDKYDV